MKNQSPFANFLEVFQLKYLLNPQKNFQTKKSTDFFWNELKKDGNIISLDINGKSSNQ